MTFNNELEKYDIAGSRQQDITNALKQLHGALCKLDHRNLRNFMKKPLSVWLQDYALIEGWRDVIGEYEAARIERVLSNFDPGEGVEEYTDKAHELMEDLVELGLPGAMYTHNMLSLLRQAHEEKKSA